VKLVQVDKKLDVVFIIGRTNIKIPRVSILSNYI